MSKGFAGLDALVSDVSQDVNRVAAADPAGASKSAPPTLAPATPPLPAQAASQPSSSRETPASRPGKSAVTWAVLSVIAVGILIANSASKNNTQPRSSFDSTSVSSTAAPAQIPAPDPASLLNEQIPPVGRDNLLGIPQIRWCAREKIKIETIEGVLNDASERDITRFNAKVDNYNSRCAHYRYRRGDVESVNRELAAERDLIASKAKIEWRLNSASNSATSSTLATGKPSTANTQANASRDNATASADGLSFEERESIESACSTPKILEGPAAYRKCVSQKVSALRSNPRNIDLSSLTHSEKESIESACSTPKILDGPAEYNKCLTRKLAALRSSPRNVDLSGLNHEEKESIESACSTQKTLDGPAEYNKCLIKKLAALKTAPRDVDLSRLGYFDRNSIQSACSEQKTLHGPADYNRCLTQKLRQFGR